jgi:(p)ppGpp synthase/HD superfamily hydrolase
MESEGVEDGSGGRATVLGARFAEAVAWVAELHRDQVRKGKPNVPYVSHLLAVAALVLEAGGSETEAIAALLHDAAEDQDVPLADIAARFGERVAAIVDGCTDTLVLPGDDLEAPDPGRAVVPRGRGDWRARKTAYLDHLAHEGDESVLLVSAADKLHDARAMVADLRAGPPAWAQFNASPHDQLWYYGGLYEALAGRIPEYLDRELMCAVDEMVERTDLELETAAWEAAHATHDPEG